MECPTLTNEWAMVSFVFFRILYQVLRRVSATHSMAIKGAAINDAGALRSLWYHFQFVNALWTASFMFDAVLPIHSTGSKTQYRAVFVASEIVYSHVQTVARGATQTVFHSLFHIFFQNHMIFLL